MIWRFTLALVLLALVLLPMGVALASSNTSSEFKISVDPTAHETYGLSYPVTYVFELPANIQSAKVYYRYSLNETYIPLTEKTPSDFFNGINAVRFNYSEHRAYVSIAFAPYSDDIYLKFTDGQGSPINVTFVEIAKYYDNRKAVVTATADDWIGLPDFDQAFKNACKAFRERQMWITVGIVPRYNTSYTNYQEVLVNWTSIQEEIDAGFVEPASHSMTHPHTPYDDYDWEIGASKQYIIDNLTLPKFNRKGSKEYVYVWIRPYGDGDSVVRQKLGQYKYLIDRDTTTNNPQWFSSWDSTNGLYNPVGRSIMMGSDGVTDLATLNSAFDTAYNNGGIYHLMMHPIKVDWSNGSYALQHLDYISGRKDVWYVAFGHLYVYHYVQERGVVNITAIPPKLQILDVLSDSNEVSKPIHLKVKWLSTIYNLSNLTFKFDFNNDGVWDKIVNGSDEIDVTFTRPDIYTIKVEVEAPDGFKTCFSKQIRVVSKKLIINATNIVNSTTGLVVWANKGGNFAHVNIEPISVSKDFTVIVHEENIYANNTSDVILNVTFIGLAGGDKIWLNETIANAISVDLLHNGEQYLTAILVKNHSVNLTLEMFSTYTLVVNNSIPAPTPTPAPPKEEILVMLLILTTVGSILVVIILLIRRKQEVAKTRIESEFKFFRKL